MKNRKNVYDRTGSSQDFSNNEGYHNYQDYTDRSSFRNTPYFTDRQRDDQRYGRQDYRNERSDFRSDYRAGSQGGPWVQNQQDYSPNQQRSEWNRPSLQNSDRYESQGADYGASSSLRGSQSSHTQYPYMPSNTSDASMYGADIPRTGPAQFGQGSYGPGSYQSDRFDERYNANYGYGATSTPRREYESSRFGASDSRQTSNLSGNFSWQSPERRSGLHAGKGPKGYRRSDERIREEASEALSAHDEIDASEIEIEVKEGMVTLSGAVESRQIKRLAEDTVEAISGVQDVRNDLRVIASTEASSRLVAADGEATSSRSGNLGKAGLAGRQSSTSQSTSSSKSVQ